MTPLSTIAGWLERMARGDLTGTFEVQRQAGSEDEPELASIADLMRRVQTRWMAERQDTLQQMVSDMNETVALRAKAQQHLETQAKMTARLRHADRMAAMGRLASGVAHEINNPLTLILGNLESLSDLIANPQVVQSAHRITLTEMVDEIDDGAERIRRIVQDLRQFSRTGTGGDERSVIDLVVALKTSTRVVRNQLRHRARVLTDYGPYVHGLGNESQLHQVLVNLLLNAVQAMPAGLSRAPQIVASIYPRSAEQIAIKISDNGVGIPRQNLERIFDPFFTTRDIGEGSGLGLSVAAGLVRSMDGQLTVESTEGVGSTFTVILPRAPAPDESQPASPAPPGASPTSKILVIDDEPGVVRLVVRILREHDVTAVTSGASALELLGNERFDVVLCDLMMPEISGIQLYETIKARDPKLAARFVFMTGGAFYPDAAAFLARAERPCLEKPFDRRLMLDTVEGVLAAS